MVSDRSTGDHGQDDHPELHEVGPAVEPRPPGYLRRRHAEGSPQRLAGQVQPFDRGGEDVFGDEDARVGGHQDTLGSK